jgi:DNA-binding transcriptional ArsR family regulator
MFERDIDTMIGVSARPSASPRLISPLDKIYCQGYLGFVDDVRVLANAAEVEVALDPIRASILDALTEPGSAVTVAAAVGLTRQKVNYHLKALEAHGLVELAEERVWGGITERFVRRTARHLVVSPDVLQIAALDPNDVSDRLSAAYLIAVNARTVSEVGAIASTAAGRRVPTLTVDTVIGFSSSEDRAAFATDLQSAVAALVARYHHDDGRPHRLTVSSYPRPAVSKSEEPS